MAQNEEKLETQRKRAKQDEKDLKELAMTAQHMHDSFDRKIGGVFYQLANPEYKQNFNKMLNYPAQGTFEDW